MKSSKDIKVNNLEYGPIVVTAGKYKGRIGYFDDEEGAYGYVY